MHRYARRWLSSGSDLGRRGRRTLPVLLLGRELLFMCRALDRRLVDHIRGEVPFRLVRCFGRLSHRKIAWDRAASFLRMPKRHKRKPLLKISRLLGSRVFPHLGTQAKNRW